MSDDLAERLRFDNPKRLTYEQIENAFIEAADRIEQFETAEFVGRLPDYVKELEAERDEAYDRIGGLELQLEELSRFISDQDEFWDNVDDPYIKGLVTGWRDPQAEERLKP